MYEEIVPYIAPLLVPVMKDIAGSIYEHAIDDIGGTIYENLRKLERWLRGKGLKDEDIKRIPKRILVPALQGAALCDEEELRELWAELLKAAADKTRVESVHPAFINIISSLSLHDVVVLYRIKQERSCGNEDNDLVSLDNLRRLMLIEFPVSTFKADNFTPSLTALGRAFLTVCGEK